MEDTRSVITTKLLNELETEPTIKDAMKAYKLLEGTLNPEEEKEYQLKIWMHSEVTASDLDSMNAIFQGKISVITRSTKKIPPLIDTIKNLPIVSNGNGLYEVGHAEAEITYTEDIEVQNRLKQTEYRYAGQNPDNYVKFNNELWRIIGLVNTPEGQRVKIIRNESIGNYCNDTVPRTTTWTGKIGLMYPSDYGYATSGGSGVARETCLTKVLYGWKDNAVNDCKSNNWLYDNSISQWAMLPIARSGYANDVITVSNNGNADDHFANNAYASFPTVYLQENVKVASGNGTMTEPYLLKI